MPGVLLLAAAVVVNYTQHRRHRATVCQLTRRTLPPRVFAAAFTAGFAYLLTHVLRGYQPRAEETP